jgi:3-hydroxyacyl-CoA dehydrogenase/3-hydroxy-2-methylbutyryl-CoA dehydrogenase
MLIDLSRENVQGVAEQIGKDALFSVSDVSNESQIKESIATTLTKWGKINCAVNCAGIATPMRTLSKRGPHDLMHFQKVLQVNTIGTFNIIRLVADAMSTNDFSSSLSEKDQENHLNRGVIINTASIAAMEGQIGQAAYAASKGAIVSMTLPIARDLAHLGIRVCTIAPGLFSTPMLEGLPEKVQNDLASSVPFPKRLGKPDEFASLVESIILNPMINGETIRLDGALRMQP